jgi:hypothetical protein
MLLSSSFAKKLGELKSGRQHQSMEPVSEIKAAVLPLPITP